MIVVHPLPTRKAVLRAKGVVFVDKQGEVQVFVYREGSRDPEVVDIPTSALPSQISEALHDGSGKHLWREGGDTPLRGDLPAIFGPGEVLHVSPCDRITTVVNYLRLSKTGDFPPSVPLRHILEWAENTFQVESAERPNLRLAVCGQPNDFPSLRTHLGSIAVDCRACFDLVPIRKTEG